MRAAIGLAESLPIARIKSMKSWMVVGFCAVGALAACGGALEGDEASPAGDVEVAEVATEDLTLWTDLAVQAYAPSWQEPACIAKSDSPPGFERATANTCSGPWSYHKGIEVNVADQHCAPIYPTCDDWSFGIRYTSF